MVQGTYHGKDFRTTTFAHCIPRSKFQSENVYPLCCMIKLWLSSHTYSHWLLFAELLTTIAARATQPSNQRGSLWFMSCCSPENGCRNPQASRQLIGTRCSPGPLVHTMEAFLCAGHNAWDRPLRSKSFLGRSLHRFVLLNRYLQSISNGTINLV